MLALHQRSNKRVVDGVPAVVDLAHAPHVSESISAAGMSATTRPARPRVIGAPAHLIPGRARPLDLASIAHDVILTCGSRSRKRHNRAQAVARLIPGEWRSLDHVKSGEPLPLSSVCRGCESLLECTAGEQLAFHISSTPANSHSWLFLKSPVAAERRDWGSVAM